MSYGRARNEWHGRNFNGATVTHSAELVRGNYLATMKAPSSGPSGHLLPKGRRAAGGFWSRTHD